MVSKRDEAYRYEFSVIEKVLKMKRDKAITSADGVSVATAVSSSMECMFDTEIECSNEKIFVKVRCHKSSKQEHKSDGEEKKN